MVEDWKPAFDWPGYSVSSLGRIRSERRSKIRSNGRPHTIPEKIVALSMDTQGYLQFHPYKNNKRKSVLVHRAVFQSHVRPLEKGEQIDHIDGNKLNNRLDNLQPVDGHQAHSKLTYERIYKDIFTKGYEAGCNKSYKEAMETGYKQGHSAGYIAGFDAGLKASNP